jgi:hypothetical protein
LRKFIRGNRGIRRESYHSYPDPEEKPKITAAVSTYKKTINKKDAKGFSVDAKFKLDTEFPGVITSSGISNDERPVTCVTKLSNGVTVCSQDTLGLMTTISFLLAAGR